MKYRHYAPRARLTLVHGEGEALRRFREERRGEGAVFLLNSDSAEEPDVIPLGGDAREQARRLFAALRELDERGAEVAYAQAPKPEGLGLAVYNRLLRAAAFRETYLKY
jgi:L-threonylcarbamoyladenylate synthase